MNKFFTKIAGLSLGLAMAIGVGVAVGSKEARVASAAYNDGTAGESTWSGSYASETITWTFGDLFTIKQEKNGAQTAPNSSYISAPRWYKDNKVTITPNSNVSIHGLQIQCTTSGYATALSGSTYTNASASADGQVVTITSTTATDPIVIVLGGQSRITDGSTTKLKYWYTSGGGGGGGGSDLDGKTGTVNFGSATGSIPINKASGTGKDDLDVTWSYTVNWGSATASYTQNASYSQIGASGKLCTSVTLTASFSDSYKVTAFSVKTGGFSGTSGTSTLKVGTTTVGSGSVSSSDVVTTATNTTTVGNNLTVLLQGSSTMRFKLYYISYTLASATETQTITASADSAYSDETITLTTNATSASWTITANTAGATISPASGKTTTITPTSAGSVTVQAVASGYTTVSKTVSFTERPQSAYITLAKNSTSGYTGQNETISFTYGNLDGTLGVQSSNTSAVTVDTPTYSAGSGSVKINFVGAGTNVPVYFKDGSTTLATLSVTITASTVTITGLPSTSDAYIGRTLNLGSTITVTATGSYSDSVTWESDDESIATVTSAGVVSGVSSGSVDITVTSVSDGSVSMTCTVSVSPAPLDTTYVFATNYSTYASTWNSTYGEKTLAGTTDVGGDYTATIVLARANKQSSGVGSDKPYICGNTNADAKMITFTLTETGYKIKDVTITFEQRGTNAPAMKLFKGDTNTGTALDSGTIGTKNTLSTTNLNDTIFTVTLNAGGTSNKGVALTSIYISVEAQSSFGTLDHIKITGLPNVVYHVGETYSATGLVVTAYDGADESTANFKDVTASVETDLDNPTPFIDSDVPGFDCDVQYTGDGGSDTKSFHVYVFALAEYELVTSEPADWSGQYLIVGIKDTTNLAMNGALENIDVEGNHKTVTPDANDVIEDGQELEWTIASYSTGYSIQGKSGKYIGWSSGSGNGLTVSDTALVNTLSISGEDVTIAGSGGRHLSLNTDGSGRFRYYQSGTVKLYRLKESDNADAFAQLFLGAFTCDSSGINKPTFAWKEEGVTRWSWSLLITEYNTLTSVEKEQFRLGVASETGTNIEKAIARYDYIVGKYFKTGIDTSFTDFMNRNPAAIGSSSIMLATVAKNSGTTIAIIAISAVSLAAIGGYFLFRKKKED